MQKTSNDQTTILFAIFTLGLLVSPWPLGSNRDWAWPLLTCLFSLVALNLIYRPFRLVTLHARVALTAFACLLMWILWQWMGIPGLSDPISLDRFSTRSDLLLTLTYGCIFFATIELIKSESRIRTIAYAIIITGLLQALLGGVQQLVFDVPRARGSFPNPNHFAGYLEVALGLGVGLMLAQTTTSNSAGKSPIVDFLTGPLGRLRIIIIIMVVALVMSRSRMGNIAFFTSILLTAAIGFYHSRTFSRYTAFLIVSILVLDTFIIGNYFGIERLGERLRNTTTESSGRVELHSYNLEIVRDNLWQGTGAGTYERAFQRYRDARMTRRANHAETDYLEFLIELGTIGVIPLIVILITGLHAQVRLLNSSIAVFERGIAFGCLAGTIALLIHGIADVNLQIPSNAMLLVFILSLPIAILESHLKQPAEDH